ncbi:MAG: tRNA glutamyl-Q(34) synthetase GluQRS [Rhodothermales bacterium]
MRGRYAPSPTGRIHVGNARTALAAWLSIRSRGGTFVWRLEDLDGPRVVPGLAEAAEQDLAWLGLDWDEGPDVGGSYTPYQQSERSDCYEAALAHLLEDGRLFPCRRSRKDLRALASAPHGHDGRPPYPAHLRPKDLDADWFSRVHDPSGLDAAIRFQVHGRPVVFEDRIYGTVTERVDETVGDFVLKRRDGLYAYQLAVVVDDLLMGIGEVVRGADLLDSTARQIQLIEALGGARPVYAHLPLVVDTQGEKLSKRNASLDLHALRETGVQPAQLAGYLGYSLGLLSEPTSCAAPDLISRFRWDRIPKAEWRLPDDLPERLLRL